MQRSCLRPGMTTVLPTAASEQATARMTPLPPLVATQDRGFRRSANRPLLSNAKPERGLPEKREMDIAANRIHMFTKVILVRRLQEVDGLCCRIPTGSPDGAVIADYGIEHAGTVAAVAP